MQRSGGRMGSWTVLIGVVVLLGLWGGVSALGAGAHGAAPHAASPVPPAAPAICNGGCGGSGYTMSITVEVTGVPQYWLAPSVGMCLTSPPDANCQVFVSLNLAFSLTAGVGSDIRDVPVEPGDHAYTFNEGEGGTGFTASYNDNECDLSNVANGCFVSSPSQVTAYNYPGPNSEPYFWVEGTYGPQTVFVPGCSGMPYGQIFGPSGAPADDSATIDLAYASCPGTPADGGGGGGEDDGGGNLSLNDTNGSWDPCPANGTNDSDCLNATAGHLDVSGYASAATTACAACAVLMNDSIPITYGDHGEVSTYLWNGSYAWSATFNNRSPTDPGGKFDLAAGSSLTYEGRLLTTYNVTFGETGLPTGMNWSLWINGTSVTTSNPTISVQEPNGTVSWMALADPPSPGGKAKAGMGYVASNSGAGGPGFYGNLTVAGDINADGRPDLAFALAPTVPLTIKEVGVPTYKGSPDWEPFVWCASYVHPALAHPRTVAGVSAPLYGITSCSSGGSITFPAIPEVFSGSGGGTAGGFASPGSGVFKNRASHPTTLLGEVAITPRQSPCPCQSSHWRSSFVPTQGMLNVTTVDKPVTAKAGLRAVPVQTIFVSRITDGGSFCAHVAVNTDPPLGRKTVDATICPKTEDASLELPNGTYQFTLKPVPGWIPVVGGVESLGGIFTVEPQMTPINISWVPFTFPVTFAESGLPAGTNWSVAIPHAPNPNASDHDWSSITGTITVSLGNGSYKFSVVPVPGYTATAKPSSVKVHGGAAQVAIVFTPAKGGGTGAPFSSWGLMVGASVAVPGALQAARPAIGRRARRSP